jgi:magnesium transporter
MNKKQTQYADDDYESIRTLFKLRAPALIIGLLLGFCISLVASNFEEVLAKNIHVAFFLPFIVYIADAIGTQTSAIYSRGLKCDGAKLSKYLYKETILGIVFGIVFSICAGAVALLWIGNSLLAISVAVATLIVIASAPIIGLLVTQIFQSIHEDPAAGSGPIATVIQDMVSVLIYGIVCSVILL